jgi:hypothetical protein
MQRHHKPEVISWQAVNKKARPLFKAGQSHSVLVKTQKKEGSHR